jgi:hypothetical protein
VQEFGSGPKALVQCHIYTIDTDPEGDIANGDVYDIESIMHYHSAQNADEDATCNSAIRQADTCPLSQKVDISKDDRTFRRMYIDPALKPFKFDILFVKTFYPYQR